MRFLFLLCALLIAVSTASFTCVACDALEIAHDHGHAAAEAAIPSAGVDLCNGICSCCSFHPVPCSQQDEISMQHYAAIASAYITQPVKALRLPLTPPPRG